MYLIILIIKYEHIFGAKNKNKLLSIVTAATVENDLLCYFGSDDI